MFKHRYYLIVSAILCAFTSFAFAATDDFSISQIYPIDRIHSYIGFSIKYMGFAKVRGRFTDFSGTIRFDEKDITNSSGTVFIKVDSINTEHDMRDKDLKSANWFDAEKFPYITFQSKRILQSESGVEAIGDLTIKGVTREVRLKMDSCSGIQKDVREDAQVILTGGTTVNRKDFGVEGERWSKLKEGITAVDFDVDIELSVLGKQVKAPNFKNWFWDPKSAQSKIYGTIRESGVESGIQEFREWKAANEKDAGMSVLNTVGYMLLLEGKIDDAIRVLKENEESFPQDPNVYDSLGEAYAVKGDRENAIRCYTTSLEKDPMNVNAVEILRHLKGID